MVSRDIVSLERVLLVRASDEKKVSQKVVSVAEIHLSLYSS